LEGGLPKWKSEGREIETGPPSKPEKVVYRVPSFNQELVKNMNQMLTNITTQDFQVLDARSEGR
jgi:thiosulfate/3-mercaptopyruvate sulfurtransferase